MILSPAAPRLTVLLYFTWPFADVCLCGGARPFPSQTFSPGCKNVFVALLWLGFLLLLVQGRPVGFSYADRMRARVDSSCRSFFCRYLPGMHPSIRLFLVSLSHEVEPIRCNRQSTCYIHPAVPPYVCSFGLGCCHVCAQWLGQSPQLGRPRVQPVQMPKEDGSAKAGKQYQKTAGQAQLQGQEPLLMFGFTLYGVPRAPPAIRLKIGIHEAFECKDSDTFGALERGCSMYTTIIKTCDLFLCSLRAAGL